MRGHYFCLYTIGIVAALLAKVDNASAAHCFCKMMCGSQIVQPHTFDDPLSSYTQFGNREIPKCRKYCQGRLDQLFPGPYFQNLSQYAQCLSFNNATHKCNLTFSIQDSVGTAPYYNVDTKVFSANLTNSCPAGQQMTGDELKCGTLNTSYPQINLPNQYITPNMFLYNQFFYNIVGNTTHLCTP
jgi:hypothetical protein